MRTVALVGLAVAAMVAGPADGQGPPPGGPPPGGPPVYQHILRWRQFYPKFISATSNNQSYIALVAEASTLPGWTVTRLTGRVYKDWTIPDSPPGSAEPDNTATLQHRSDSQGGASWMAILGAPPATYLATVSARYDQDLWPNGQAYKEIGSSGTLN
jgi:hypothetical protein